MDNREKAKEKVYWCQCFEVNRRLSEQNIGRSITRDTVKICPECGYKIFEEEIIDK